MAGKAELLGVGGTTQRRGTSPERQAGVGQAE